MKIISSKSTILELVSEHEEIASIMVDLGFVDIVKPLMLQSAGRFMTLEKGSKMKGIPWSKIVEAFEIKGFIIKEE